GTASPTSGGRAAAGCGGVWLLWRAPDRSSGVVPLPVRRSDRGNDESPSLCRRFFGGPFLRARKPGAGAVEPRDAFGDLLLADDQRRQQPYDIIAGGDRDHFFGAERIDELTGRHARAHADEEAFAPHLGNDRRISIFDLRKQLLEEEPGAPHTVEETGLQHDVEHRVSSAHGKRVAAEGRAMHA